MDPRRRIEDALGRSGKRASKFPVLMGSQDLFAVPKNLRRHYDYQLLQMAVATTEVLLATATETLGARATHPGDGAEGTDVGGQLLLDVWPVHIQGGQSLMLTAHGRLLVTHALDVPQWCACQNSRPGVLPELRRQVTLAADLCVGLRPAEGPTVWINAYEALTKCAVEALRG